jgi:hypothetical protein
MAKSQKRSSKEAKKAKDPQKGDKKRAGPKYLREAETLQANRLSATRSQRK